VPSESLGIDRRDQQRTRKEKSITLKKNKGGKEKSSPCSAPRQGPCLHIGQGETERLEKKKNTQAKKEIPVAKDGKVELTW